MHHGVRIKGYRDPGGGNAFHRYITDRFLPDKAIDLIDESIKAASLRMQLDSLPTEIDEIERRILQWKSKRQALLRESDAHSKERLKQLEGGTGWAARRVRGAQGALAGGEGRGRQDPRDQRADRTIEGRRAAPGAFGRPSSRCRNPLRKAGDS